jgi:hypothetical protein
MPKPVLQRLAGLAGTPGMHEIPEAHEANIPRRPVGLRQSEWSFRDWTLRAPALRLEMAPAAASQGFTIEILALPDAGAAVEVRLDGELVAISGARRGDVLTVRHPLRPGPAYLLEIEAVSGGQLVPGAVRLLAGAS